MNKIFILVVINLIFLINFQTKVLSKTITYKEILDNPIDLELNLNYAKQQEKTGNLKSTIATLERLSILYPKNSDIKLYLLSILLKMDSKIKVDLMVKTMLDDPNTTDETKLLIAELLTDQKIEKVEAKKWIAYLDLNYSQTEEDNISGRSKSGKILASNAIIDAELPFPNNDTGDGDTMEYDKTYVRSSSLTLGRILDQGSSLFFNLGLSANTINKKRAGESDIYSSSVSYFKAYKNHYFSPYVYYNKSNLRQDKDYQSRGIGVNNTYLFNDKINLNYALSYADSRYHSRSTPINVKGDQLFADAGIQNNNEAYSASLRFNYNLSNITQLSSKLILSDIEHNLNAKSYHSGGLNLRFSRIFPIGTFTASATHLTNVYDEKNLGISSVRDRKDRSLVTNLSLSGDINQLIPYFSRINKNNTLFYTFSFRESNVNSNIPNYEVKRAFKTFGITKRINF